MTRVIVCVEYRGNLNGIMDSVMLAEVADRRKEPHVLTVDESMVIYGTTHQGLSTEEARHRLAEHGPNEFPSVGRESILSLILRQFRSWLVALLILAVAISWIAGEKTDAWVIMAVIILNAAIGAWHEFRAQKAMDALRNMVVEQAKVIRHGETSTVLTREIVPGDIIYVEEGDLIPADARLIQVNSMRCNEATLTGESVPVSKIIAPVDKEAVLGDRKNMIWKGTFAVSGNGLGVVCATGLESEMGSISSSLAQMSDVRSDFLKKTDVLARQMSLVAIGSTIALFCMGYLIQNMELREILLVSIAALVAAIPEGLPAVLAIVLAIGAGRMAKRNAIIRDFTATQTLGAVTAILTDKTGTLTMNRLTVRNIFIPPGRIIRVTGEGLDLSGSWFENGTMLQLDRDKALAFFVKSSLASNDSKINISDDGKDPELIGDPTEVALRIMAMKSGLHDIEIHKSHDIPFRSENKFRATLIEGGVNEIHMTGAPEVVLDMCTHYFDGVSTIEFTSHTKADIEGVVKEWGASALRVVALAYKNTVRARIGKDDLAGFTFLGLTGMIDPPRPEVAEAIHNCHAAGIRVLMLTGDHVDTAAAIAKEVGIVDGRLDKSATAMNQKSLERLDDEEFDEAISTHSIFARLAPNMKLRIVNRLRSMGEMVAVTGDGVNDAPALKAADVGVAMGKAGTDLARESADVVLTDDNFTSIVNAVEEGRIVFINARQTSAFLVTTNIAESVTLLIAIGIGLPLPLTATQLLWLNLVTDTMTDMSLATEPGHSTLEESGKDLRGQKLLNKQVLPFLVINVAIMSILAVLALRYYIDEDIETARTAVFSVMAFTQLFNVFNMRSLKHSAIALGLFSNKFVNWAIAVSAGLILMLIYIDPLADFFNFVELPWQDMLVMIGLSSLVLWGGEIYKLTQRPGAKPNQ